MEKRKKPGRRRLGQVSNKFTCTIAPLGTVFQKVTNVKDDCGYYQQR